MILVAISSKRSVATLFVIQDGLQCHLLGQVICLVGRVGCRPVHRTLKLFHSFGGKLHLAMAGFAILKLLEIFLIKSEVREIRKLRRVTELTERQVARQLAHRVCVRCEFEIKLRSRIDVHGTENKDLIRGRGIQSFRDRLSFPDSADFIVIQPNEFAKEPVGLGRIVGCLNSACAHGKEKQSEQRQTWNSSAHGTLLYYPSCFSTIHPSVFPSNTFVFPIHFLSSASNANSTGR